MSGAVFPPCWLSGLRHPSTGAYRLLGGPGLGAYDPGKMSGFSESSCRWHSDISATGVHIPKVSYSLPPPSQKTLQDQQVGLAQAPMKSLLLLWVLVCVRPWVHPPWVEFFTPVLWSSCTQAPLAFKAKYSGGSSSWCQTRRLGSLIWGSEFSLLWENFCDIIVLQFVGHPPWWYGIWLYCEYAPSYCLLEVSSLCLWM